MNQTINFTRSLIAPCGINCGTCIAYLRDKNKCPGCLNISGGEPTTRVNCRIKTCEHFIKAGARFCYECDVFPCPKLKQLDKRYRTKYRTNPIRNLETISAIGLAGYLAKERLIWACPSCGAGTSVHKESCLECGRKLGKKALMEKNGYIN
ncbi:MAG TPA: DUF3795 domain-containing protein [Cyclobacteriaceae bacterium]|nr:DUF3795 domain-containing protein [Cyclobacteriaceae bacterium]